MLVLPGPPAYRTHHNARFGYHLHYPGALRPQPEPANGTYGRRFVLADGHLTLTAYASYN